MAVLRSRWSAEEREAALRYGIVITETMTVRDLDDRGDSLRILVRNPKQGGAASVPTIVFAYPDNSGKVHLCPVRAWRTAMRARSPPIDPLSPAFMQPNGTPIFYEDLAAELRAVAEELSLPRGSLTPHSLRSGGASAYAAHGVSDSNIKVLGRWRTLESLSSYQHIELMEQRQATEQLAAAPTERPERRKKGASAPRAATSTASRRQTTPTRKRKHAAIRSRRSPDEYEDEDEDIEDLDDE